jgi:hypothetical protein
MPKGNDYIEALRRKRPAPPAEYPTAADYPDPEKLRAILAQLIPPGSGYRDETIWAAQGRNQWPPPRPDLVDRPTVSGDTVAPIKSFPFTADPALNFPIDEIRTWVKPKLDIPPAPKPFPGATSVEQVGPYELPKSPPKKTATAKR